VCRKRIVRGNLRARMVARIALAAARATAETDERSSAGEIAVTHASKIAAALIALGLAACAAEPQVPPSGAPIALSPATEGEVAAYLGKVRAVRPGAFAVSPDGRNSFYTWCDDTACAASNYSLIARRGCQQLAGADCLVLYVRNQPRLTSTRATDAAAGGQHGSQKQQRIEWDNRDR
jgi:hypothetical protein